MIEKSNRDLKINSALIPKASILWGELFPFAVLGVGVVCVVKGLIGPELDFRALIIALFAIVFRPVRVNLRVQSAQSLSMSLWHAALFAGAITLGPFAAALPAAFSGISRLIFGPKVNMALHDALYLVLEPVAACAASSMVYVALGGDLLRPQGVDSIMPALGAGFAYVAVNALTSRIKSARARLADLAICLSLGSALAAAFAIAPAYALVAPCLGVAFAAVALREPKKKIAPVEPEAFPEIVLETEEAPAPEPDTFVDSMTGLANERYLTMFLGRELARAARAGTPLSIALFDLDDAKKLGKNQELLNKCIIELGNRLKSGLREYDLVARHSEHRLLVVLPEASVENAYEVVTRLHRFATADHVSGHQLSTSVGIASFPEDGADTVQLINTAHRILNHGRFMGANCVHINHKLAKAG